ncbi:3-oxoacyl-ACP synthase [Streptomyces sp. NPDC052164]|uniref:3-oxoacyl-ACP synthase n=1 Tax=unclassified Streptomyces TaxID=2593676 RepID=UPI00343EA1C6
MDDSVVITAAASGEVDTADLWQALAAGRDGWQDVNKWTRELPERIAEMAGEALAGAAVTGAAGTDLATPDPAATACVIGSGYGSGHVAETIRARLDAGARSSLAPESFLYFNAHGVTSLICLRHRLRGYCATVLGAGAGLQALAIARRRLRPADAGPVLCGTYELLSPAAARARGSDPVSGRAAFLVLETAARARGRGARVLGTLGPVETFPLPAADRAARPGDPLVTAPLAELVSVVTGTGAPTTATVTAAGGRTGYRCTASRKG